MGRQVSIILTLDLGFIRLISLETRLAVSRVYHQRIAKLLFERAQFSKGTFERALTSYVDVVASRVTYTPFC